VPSGGTYARGNRSRRCRPARMIGMIEAGG
jgi:hypothetical protein